MYNMVSALHITLNMSNEVPSVRNFLSVNINTVEFRSWTWLKIMYATVYKWTLNWTKSGALLPGVVSGFALWGCNLHDGQGEGQRQKARQQFPLKDDKCKIFVKLRSWLRSCCRSFRVFFFWQKHENFFYCRISTWNSELFSQLFTTMYGGQLCTLSYPLGLPNEIGKLFQKGKGQVDSGLHPAPHLVPNAPILF